ncbi:MAG: NAD(P)H-binding protein [Acidobacteriia bacterium]|nr:NAD(P)H-binding protein [Terriglobia bacterium]
MTKRASDCIAVTGAFGYSGKYITARLLAAGARVRTLTNSPRRDNPFAESVEVHPYNFDDPEALVRSLEGARVLVNTYWVRFDHADFTHAQAVRNTLRLFEAASRAQVSRIVHVSITHPSARSPLPYFRGKAELEEALRASGMSYAILRPAVLFGEEDILINNIAWMLRRFPIFGVFGDGHYKLQPIFVDDLAQLAVDSAMLSGDTVVDAIGPETFTYRELVGLIGDAIGRRRPVISIPPGLGVAVARLLGALVGDVVVTREEVAGLMQNLLVTDSPPAGRTALCRWAFEHRDTLGRRYSSELARRRDRLRSYEDLRRRA